jgi:hypothetical protein
MKQIISALVFLLLLFCLSTFVFDPTKLYYELWWLDIPMHVLGGFGVASLSFAVLQYKHSHVTFKKVIIHFLIIAVVWEVYEGVRDIASFGVYRGEWIDTFADIINGAIGATFAYFFLK